MASAFDCSVFLARAHPVGRWVFVGAAPSGEIARYAFEVLFRQAKSARAHYIKTALKRCTTTRTRRADLFCEGWVLTATELVERFSGSEAAQARVTAYLEHKHKLTSFEGQEPQRGPQPLGAGLRHGGRASGREGRPAQSRSGRC